MRDIVTKRRSDKRFFAPGYRVLEFVIWRRPLVHGMSVFDGFIGI